VQAGDGDFTVEKKQERAGESYPSRSSQPLRGDPMLKFASILNTVALLTICSFANAGPVKAEEDVADTFARIRQSLALVVSSGDKFDALGTAFCVASNDSHSYFLTNNHVLIGDRVSVRLDTDGGLYSARIVRRAGASVDAALLEIDRGNLPVLTMSATPRAGTPIAVAGYPSFHLITDLKASVHLGSINSIMGGGKYIEHDALTDHGNSGGPLFDQKSGVVYGINTEFIQSRTSKQVVNALATSISAVLPFLENAKIGLTLEDQSASGAVSQGNNSSRALTDSTGAYRVGYFAAPASQAGAEPIKKGLDAYIQERVASFIGGQLFPLLLSDSKQSAFQRVCREQKINALFLALYDWKAEATGRRNHITANAKLGVTDCSGTLVYQASGHNESDRSDGDIGNDYLVAAKAAADVALTDIQGQVTKSPTTAVNLVRYGFPIPSGSRSTGLHLIPGSDGAIVDSVTFWGTAARAGLERLDIVTSLNGLALGGLQQGDIDTAIAEAERAGGEYGVDVHQADGRKVTFHFKSEDIRWYLKHPRT
jgi:S1-C subfamily serine protease